MSLPKTMTYIAANGAGGPDVLKSATGPAPEPRGDEVLVRVRAAGVNRPDVQQRKGAYPPPPGASPIVGLEIAGEVVALGPDAKGIVLGENVCALTNGGGYAEYCVAPAPQCLAWPKGYDAITAAAVPETYFTVWANVFMLGHLKAGEKFLVHGGSSGIGLTAIRLAKEFGAAKIFTTASSAKKLEFCLHAGATDAINYRERDFADAIKEATGGKGVDLILDMVGGPYAQRNLRSLALEGRLVQIAFMEGSKVENFDLTPIMVKRLTVTGSTMRPRTTAQKGAIANELREKVWPVLDAGRAGPSIYEVFPLAQAAQAHALMEEGSHIGKIMLRVD